jgi:WD40-like Beta Propeller Repeat
MKHRGPIPSEPVGAQRSGLTTAAVSALLVLAITGCAPGSAPTGQAAPTASPTIAEPSPPQYAGWVAFSADWSAGDILLVRAGEPAHRIFGSDDDGISRMCPSFAADGVRFAFGEGTGDRETGWTNSALVIAEVTAEGEGASIERFELDELAHPPCPIWSPDGRWIALGADTADQRVARVVSDVWLVDTSTGGIRVLTGLEATDLEWAPDGSDLYIAGPAGIRVHSPGDDEIRTLDDTALSTSLTVSPDGTSLVVERRRTNAAQRYDLLLMNADGSDQRMLVKDYAQMHSIGPVWSPDGSRVVFPRSCSTVTAASGEELACSEQHDVILVTVDDAVEPIGTQHVVPLVQTGSGEDTWTWFPYTASWSPDGRSLLYLAWGESEVGSADGEYAEGLLVVPVEPLASPPEILYETSSWIDVYAGFPRNTFQSWSTDGYPASGNPQNGP